MVTPQGQTFRTPGSADIRTTLQCHEHAQEKHLLLQEPRLSCFSGLQGRDSPFGRWKMEIRSLCTDGSYGKQTILLALRKSLKSPAADVVLRLGEKVSVDQILSKFESIYGTVRTGEELLQMFYSARQENEDCAAWYCRLEDLLHQASEKNAVSDKERHSILSNRFWSGLREVRIKDALRQGRHTLNVEDMVKEARILEAEVNSCQIETNRPKLKPQQSVLTTDDGKLNGKLEQILEKISRLESEIQKHQCELEARKQSESVRPQHEYRSRSKMQTGRRPVTCYNCGKEGHLAFGCRPDQPITCENCKKAGHFSTCCRHLN